MPTTRAPRVGDVLELGKNNIGEPDEVEIVRKELPCEMYKVRRSDGTYAYLFTCPRTKKWWLTEIE